MTILVVDDHAAFRQVVKAILQTAGARFVECQDGQEAVELFPRLRPDLVLMDIAMKGLDGLSATAQIKARFPAARIIMLTEFDDPDLREAAQRAGVCGYVLKEHLSQLLDLLEDG